MTRAFQRGDLVRAGYIPFTEPDASVGIVICDPYPDPEISDALGYEPERQFVKVYWSGAHYKTKRRYTVMSIYDLDIVSPGPLGRKSAESLDLRIQRFQLFTEAFQENRKCWKSLRSKFLIYACTSIIMVG